MSQAVAAPERQFKGRLARTLLFTLLLLSVTPLLVMGSTAYLGARDLLSEQVYELMGAVSAAQAERFDSRVETGRLLLSRAAGDPATATLIARLAAHPDRAESRFNIMRLGMLSSLQLINQPNPFFSQFFLVLPGGEIHAASDRAWEGIQLDEKFDFTGTKALSTTSWGFTERIRDQLVLLTWVPVYSTEGQIVGYLTGLAEPPVIRTWLDESNFYTPRSYLATASGLFIGANPDPDGREELLTLEAGASQQQVFQSSFLSDIRQGVVEFDATDGDTVIAAYTWIPGLSIGWVAEMPRSRLFSQINALTLSSVLLFVLLAALVTVILGVAIRRLVRPLRTLSDTVRLFAGGDWQQRAPVNRSDEIGLLAYSFNQMAEELSELYQSLEARVEARTRQVQANAEVSTLATSSYDLDDMLDRLARLVQDRFGYPFVAIYLADSTGQQASIRQAAGPAEVVKRSLHTTIHLDKSGLPGWVIASRAPRWESLPSTAFPAEGRVELLSYARAEAAVPIFVAGHSLGAIFVQSTGLDGFTEEHIDQLQSIANGIAPALHSAYLLETAQVNLEEIRLVYSASNQIAQAEGVPQILEISRRTLEKSPYQAALLLAQGLDSPLSLAVHTLPEERPGLSLSPDQIRGLAAPLLVEDLGSATGLPQDLQDLVMDLGGQTAAFLPVRRLDRLVAVLILAPPPLSERFSLANLQPYTNLVELVVTTLEKIWATQDLQKGLEELQVIAAVGQVTARETDLSVLYREIHRQIERILGQVDFYIARYDPQTRLIAIPYMTDGDRQLQVDAFPLGEGLTSYLIQSRRSMLLSGDVEARAAALGAKVSGSRARSWLGVPMLVAGQPTGAIVVQDSTQAGRFTEEDERLLSTLAGQIAMALRNASLLENTRRQAESERQLFEITSKIRRSTDMRTILQTTANELGTLLHARRARIAIHLDEPASGPGEAGEPHG